MTPQEFNSLLKYYITNKHRPRLSNRIVSRRSMKNISKRQQGRALVPLEQLFITSKNSI